MSDIQKSARRAGELLLELNSILGAQGFDVSLRLDIENASAVYEVFKSVTKLGTWHTSWAVTLQALATQTTGLVLIPIRMADDLRRSFDEWYAIKQAKEQA